MSTREITLRIAGIEGIHLDNLLAQLTAAIAASEEKPDPAVARFTPTPYPEDPAAAEEFTTATRDELLDRRAADAAVVREALAPHLPTDDESGDEPPEHIDIIIRHRDLDAWLRALNALRLVIATRLGITTDEIPGDSADPRSAVYDWLAYRLDRLIAIADATDEAEDGS